MGVSFVTKVIVSEVTMSRTFREPFVNRDGDLSEHFDWTSSNVMCRIVSWSCKMYSKVILTQQSKI